MMLIAIGTAVNSRHCLSGWEFVRLEMREEEPAGLAVSQSYHTESSSKKLSLSNIRQDRQDTIVLLL